ncbi:hypothetical protein [Methylomonas methanica]|uniref:PEP-CTERM sorting domain-containing protein n=1 Tax=Methylomonas methanica (strain DSM 25384 / MC09) TaxID=857087 RepID=G0A4M0_METMM|nr:hypothetical protein [Methylomonas methanica]AEG01611.1 hypothetical protein Metme_3238 [Methylomonas methanica MC09]
MKNLALCYCLILAASSMPAQAALVNGDFAGGTGGWTISSFGGGDPANFYSIADNAGDAYLKFDTGAYIQGLQVLTFKQTLAIGSENALFSADIKVFAPTNDSTGNGSNSIQGDVITFSAQAAAVGSKPFGAVYEINRYFDANSPVGQSIGVITPLSGGFFDFNITADLSAFIGETTTISLNLLADDDHKRSSYGIDNVQLSAVPLPATLPLYVMGLAFWRFASKQRS